MRPWKRGGIMGTTGTMRGDDKGEGVDKGGEEGSDVAPVLKRSLCAMHSLG